MKKATTLFTLFVMVVTMACNNDKKKQEYTGYKKPKLVTPADSLENYINEGHDLVMPKMGKVRAAQQEAQRLIDSIVKLPPKTQAAAVTIKEKLQTLVNELNYADFAMDKWMTEYNSDSAEDNAEQHLKYLQDEKRKVDKVKEAILNGLAKADSLLKKKF